MGCLKLDYYEDLQADARKSESSGEVNIVQLWLSVDPLAEQGPQYSPYCYAFNNPINMIDPDGRWPDLPSWGSIKKSYNEAKSIVSRTYNETKSSATRNYNEAKKTIAQTRDNVVKTAKQTGNDVQKWTKDNKEQLLKGANFLQKTGDDMTTAGLVGAAVGAPIAGVGAAPGLAVATWGGAVSTAGSVLEIGVKLITQDEEATGDIGAYVAGKVISEVVDKVLPGPTPDMSKPIKQTIKATNAVIGNMIDKKVETVTEEIRK